MNKSIALVLAAVSIAASAPATRAQIDAPVWYLEYSVHVKSNYTSQGTGMRGPMSTTTVMEGSFAASAKLDMRNPGQLITMSQNANIDPEKYTKMSPAEQLQVTQQLMDAMQYAANWMPGPLDLGEEQDAMLKHMHAVSVPVRINYESTTTGKNLESEMGTKYDYLETTTATASGGEAYLGDQVRLEINSQSKKYWLVAPYTFSDMNPDGNDLKWQTVTKTCAPGMTNCDEQRSTSESALKWGIGVKLDLPNGIQEPVIEGNLDTTGRISGEKTFNGHFDGNDGLVTVTYRYTLTQTPPAPKPKGK